MHKVQAISESSLYVSDLVSSVRFYERMFGFKRIYGDDRVCAFRITNSQTLLLFKKGGSLVPSTTSGGVIPAHDGTGRLHIAFTIAAGDLPEWEKSLSAQGVTIESEVNWGHGGRSLYFRDLDGHLIELATPGLWS